MHIRRRKPDRDRCHPGGFTLLEVMIAAIILIIVMYALAQYYWRGRKQVDFEEHRRVATAVGQARLDDLRRRNYGTLGTYGGTDTTFVVDGRSYKVALNVTTASPVTDATTVTATVEWALGINPGAASDKRTAQITTIIGRVVPAP
jgi:type II secretory pathway pseudopilin PulG